MFDENGIRSSQNDTASSSYVPPCLPVCRLSLCVSHSRSSIAANSESGDMMILYAENEMGFFSSIYPSRAAPSPAPVQSACTPDIEWVSCSCKSCITIKACPDGVKKDGHFHLAPPNLKFVLLPRYRIALKPCRI